MIDDIFLQIIPKYKFGKFWKSNTLIDTFLYGILHFEILIMKKIRVEPWFKNSYMKNNCIYMFLKKSKRCQNHLSFENYITQSIFFKNQEELKEIIGGNRL